MIDKIDKLLLEELQRDAKRKVNQLAKKLNIPRTTVHNRIQKLEKIGFIKGYKAIIDFTKLNKPLTVLICVVIGRELGSKQVAAQIKKLPQIEDVYIVSGQFDIIAIARLKNTDELAQIIFDMETGLRSLHGITKTESMIVLATEKEYGAISID